MAHQQAGVSLEAKVGRVTMRAALLEEHLRALFAAFVPGVAGLNLAAGQDVSWLKDRCAELAKVWGLTEPHLSQVRDLMHEIGDAWSRRNRVIHTTMLLRDDGAPRSVRSRRGQRGSEATPLAAGELDDLAESLERLTRRIFDVQTMLMVKLHGMPEDAVQPGAQRLLHPGP